MGYIIPVKNMKTIISSNVIKLLKLSYSPGYGYSDKSEDFLGSTPGDSGVGTGRGPLSHLDTFPRERVTDYKKYLEEGMVDEWGTDKGVKPNGTRLVRKKKKGKKIKNNKDLGFIDEFDRETLGEPKMIGRVQKHWRRKSPYDKSTGAWPHQNEILYNKLPSAEPETWDSYQNNWNRGL